MSTSYSQLIARIQDWLGDRDDLVGIAPFLIAMCEDELQRELRVGEMEEPFSGTIANGVITAPSDWLEGATLYNQTAPNNPIDPVGYNSLLRRYPMRVSSGEPKQYAHISGELHFGPYPDSDYTVNGYYYKRWTRLGPVNETNWLTDDHSDLLFYGSLQHAVPYVGQDERLPLVTAGYERAKASIEKSDKQRRRPRHAKAPETRVEF